MVTIELKALIKTNWDLIFAILVSIFVTYFGATLKISDFLQASVAIVPITLVVFSVFFAFNKKFIMAALNNKKYKKELYRAFLTPTISSILSLVLAFFSFYNLFVYFLAILFLFYSLFSLIDLIVYLLDTYTKLAKYKKLI